MASKNPWIDHELRDNGTYRYTSYNGSQGPRMSKSLCNKTDSMEDAMIAALDAGLSAEEIADIQLGSGS